MKNPMFWKRPSLPHETCDMCGTKAGGQFAVTFQTHTWESDWTTRCNAHFPKEDDVKSWKRPVDVYIDTLLEGMFGPLNSY